MKAFLAIFAVVALIQLSSAGPARSKRDNELDFGESTYKFFGEAAVTAVIAADNALEKMPKTEAYAPYKKDLEGFLEFVKEGKSIKDNCFKKIFAAFEKFEEITEHWDDEDAPAEAKEVHKYLEESFDEDIAESFKEMFMNFMKLMIIDDSADSVNETERKDFEKLLKMEC